MLWLACTLLGSVGDDGADFYEARIRPVLVESCLECHGPAKQRGGLRLDSIASLLEGGEQGPAIVPGDPERSLLVRGVRYEDELFQMPPRGKLPEAAIADLEQWILRGAPGPREPLPERAQPAFDLEARRAAQWAFQPWGRDLVPAVQDSAWPRDDLDRFLLARLEAEGLEPAPEVEPLAWLRRVHYALTGLPPSPEEVLAFAADHEPLARERVVDRLLASPHYGEQWARHWLDLVGYAETRGHEFDHDLPNAWRFRDWLVRALNADLPYDQLVREQLAGDLIDPPRLDPVSGANESIQGTAFWWLGEEVHSPVSTRADQCDRMAGRIDVLTRSLLGMTVACARCHDHKFDAIAQADYYALAGFQLGSAYRQVRYETMEEERAVGRAIAAYQEEHDGALALALAHELEQGFASELEPLLLGARTLLVGGEENDSRAAALPRERLEAFAAEIERARGERDHPLSLWAEVACDPDLEAGQAFAQRLEAACVARLGAAPGAGERVLFDFAVAAPPVPWISDGLAFGERPRRAGEILRCGDPAAPSLRILPWSGVRYEPAWNVLVLDPEGGLDPGQLGYPRSGRTWLSPGFRLESGKLHYLVRGSGHVYAAVDGHKLIEGPLHARLHLTFEGDERPRWIEHYLPEYAGHWLHLELTPEQGFSGELELLRVVEAPDTPAAPEPNAALARALLASGASDVEQLAQAHARALKEALGALARGTSAGGAALEAWAPWLAAVSNRLVPSRSNPFTISALHLGTQGWSELCARIPRSSRTIPAMIDLNGADELLLLRGNPTTPAEAVPRRGPSALGCQVPTERGSGRLELARELTDPSRPLLARVYVNRLWHHVFGRGLVRTVDDFGNMGEPPTHPELLDYLALDFVREGWSTKRLLRRIVLSRAFAMEGRPGAAALEHDPKNLLWHYLPRKRLTAEELRDTILCAAGELDEAVGGPPVPVHLTELMEGRGRPGTSGPLDGAGRRSLYQAVRRNFLPPFFLVFDYPSPATTMGARNVSNVPAQALALLNDPFVAHEAERWAASLLARAGAEDERLERAWLAAFARPPDEAERAAAEAFLERERGGLDPETADPAAWTALCHVLYNSKELLYLR